MDGVRQFFEEMFAESSRNSRRLNLEKEIEELKFEEVSEASQTASTAMLPWYSFHRLQ